MTEKRSGSGFTIGPLGAIKCPSCGYKTGWGAFKKEKDLLSSSSNSSLGKSTPPPLPSSEEEKSLDETEYDQSW